ncbi:hypothetical protein [uncultured Fusobacterium sp.]|jgi:hypothetical protein|nr:hypothetical protein [uncultured Fusobacterium sp.]
MKLSNFYQKINSLGEVLHIEREDVLQMKVKELIPLLKQNNIEL